LRAGGQLPMLGPVFDLQGHRGARGLKPENTLPSFEVALDLGVTSVETDVHLTQDGVPVLCHDGVLTESCFRPAGKDAPPLPQLVRGLSLFQLRLYRADHNPDVARFPGQNTAVTPLASLFVAERQMEPYAVPTLAELFAFAEAYGGTPGRRAGKTEEQQQRCRQVHFDLELKRVPFRPEVMADGFDGRAPAELERRVVDAVRQAGVQDRTRIRSFDHRAVAAVRVLEPRLTTAVLVSGTAPVAPADMARQAGAQAYCPEAEFVDEIQVKQLHADGLRVLPWTVNQPEDWQRLLDWGVDGLTTDFPDRLAQWLRERGIAY
jgi:glycerophosphoryl diester phosphodiesterase